MSKGQSILKIK